MEEYHGKVRKGINSVNITIIDESGLLKFQDDAAIVIYYNGEGMLLIDDKVAAKKMRDELDRKRNQPLP